MHIILPEVGMTSRSGCFAIVQTNGHTHTHRQTDGHENSMTDPVKRAESVKIEKLKMRGGVRKSRKIVFLLNLGIFHVFCCCHFKTYLVLLGLYITLTKKKKI